MEKPRVEVSRAIVGLCGMQVCACKDATDPEILAVCNRDNPSGTSCGWTHVIRKVESDTMWDDPSALPVQCHDDRERLHFLVSC